MLSIVRLSVITSRRCLIFTEHYKKKGAHANFNNPLFLDAMIWYQVPNNSEIISLRSPVALSSISSPYIFASGCEIPTIKWHLMSPNKCWKLTWCCSCEIYWDPFKNLFYYCLMIESELQGGEENVLSILFFKKVSHYVHYQIYWFSSDFPLRGITASPYFQAVLITCSSRRPHP